MISLVAFWAAIANTDGRFMTAAAMPVIFNICLIGGALLIPMATGWLAIEKAMPLAAAMLAAGVLQMGMMAQLLRQAGRMPNGGGRVSPRRCGRCGGGFPWPRPGRSPCR